MSRQDHKLQEYHEQHNHHSEECGCGHEHHHEAECGCGHEHHHEAECGCNHENHEHCHEGILHKDYELPTGRVYILENLGCANCAAKMERKINELPEVKAAAITFATKKLVVSTE